MSKLKNFFLRNAAYKNTNKKYQVVFFTRSTRRFTELTNTRIWLQCYTFDTVLHIGYLHAIQHYPFARSLNEEAKTLDSMYPLKSARSKVTVIGTTIGVNHTFMVLTQKIVTQQIGSDFLRSPRESATKIHEVLPFSGLFYCDKTFPLSRCKSWPPCMSDS